MSAHARTPGRRFAKQATRHLGALATLAAIGASVTPGCSQTPVVVPVRSMERPKDVDFICLKHVADRWEGAALENCAVDDASDSVATDAEYRLHAVVTQVSRGELAVVDLARSPADTTSNLIKTDPRTPGYSFLPVSAVPSDVAADPGGEAIFVASGRDARIDIIPAGMIRGPIDSTDESGGALPWPKITLDPVNDGVAAALAVVRDDVVGAKLYVSLPDAPNNGKLAVFDLSAGALAPTRLADIALAPSTTKHAALESVTCTTASKSPWWLDYEKCFGAAALPEPKLAEQALYTRMHLAGIAVAGGKLFAADDAAPFVHVFDLASGTEERRIGVGTPTARVAVSEPVPDEVTPANARAIEICERLGWFGDGKDHAADFVPSVGASITWRQRGRSRTACNAHRYVYAIDLVDADAGDGSLIVLDVPVVLKRQDPTDATVRATGVPSPIIGESLEIDHANMSQPLACDSPAFPMRRVPLSNGGVGLGYGSNVPVRSVAFMKRDFASSSLGRKGIRAVPWPRGTLGPEFRDGVVDKTLFGKIDEAATRSDELAWAGLAAPKQLRGVFAFAALANGAVIVVDVDDYDRLARGPKASLGGTTTAVSTDELTTEVVLRHHPRLSRLYTSDAQSIINVNLSLLGTSLSTDLTSDAGRSHPHLVPLADAALVDVSAQSPFPLVSENWSMTYEGALPGYAGAAGTLVDDGTTVKLLDPAGHFCRRGVEASTAVDTNDIVQIVDAVCPSSACLIKGTTTQDPAVVQGCLDAYGLDAATLTANQVAASSSVVTPLLRTRDLLIGSAYEDHVTIAKHAELDGNGNVRWVPGLSLTSPDPKHPVPDFKTCFPGLTRYQVRAHGSWVVQGSTSGYLHRRIPSSALDPSAECVTDNTLPHVFQGRAWELPALVTGKTSDTQDTGGSLCSVSGSKIPIFANPAVKFAIRSGAQGSVRDMLFLFGLRVLTSPLGIAAVTLPTSEKTIARWVNGVDQLNWQQLAVIDGVDHGLSVYSYDFATSKNFP